MPPSAAMIAPVTKEASSLPRNSATCAISSGVPSRPIGYLRTVSASLAARSPCPRASSSGYAMGVNTVPGQIAFTRMPRCARSTAIERVSEITAPLEAV